MSLHLLLTSKKLNKLKKKLSSIHQGNTVTGQTAATKIGESDKWIQKIANDRNRTHEQTHPYYWYPGGKLNGTSTIARRLHVNNGKLKTPPVEPRNRAGVGNTSVNFTSRSSTVSSQ